MRNRHSENRRGDVWITRISGLHVRKKNTSEPCIRPFNHNISNRRILFNITLRWTFAIALFLIMTISTGSFVPDQVNILPKKWSPKMIVFDKDGTLGDCTPALKVWCRRMTNNVKRKCLDDGLSPTQKDHVISQFHQSIGWDIMADDVVPSAPLSAGTWEGIIDLSTQGLIRAGLDIEIDRVREWHDNLGDIHSADPPLIPHLADFLKHFKHHGITISICTSDDRRATNACLQNWNIADLIDYSICGDEVVECKPSAHPLMELCGRAGIMPHECMVVGDTSADTGMGRNSGAGLVVGVLTGSGTERQLLDTGAHVVLPNIGYIMDLLESHDTFNWRLADDIESAVDCGENMAQLKVKAA